MIQSERDGRIPGGNPENKTAASGPQKLHRDTDMVIQLKHPLPGMLRRKMDDQEGGRFRVIDPQHASVECKVYILKLKGHKIIGPYQVEKY